MGDYRLTITVRKHGHRDVAEESMENLLGAFEDLHPEVGAVIGANYHLGRLDATFSVQAEHAQEASTRGYEIFAEAMEAAQLTPMEIIEINAVCVGQTTAEEADRELAAA
jgi:hypothetical protein